MLLARSLVWLCVTDVMRDVTTCQIVHLLHLAVDELSVSISVEWRLVCWMMDLIPACWGVFAVAFAVFSGSILDCFVGFDWFEEGWACVSCLDACCSFIP